MSNNKTQTREDHAVLQKGYQPTIDKPLQPPKVEGGYQPIVSGDKPVAPPSKK